MFPVNGNIRAIHSGVWHRSDGVLELWRFNYLDWSFAFFLFFFLLDTLLPMGRSLSDV